VRTQLHMNDTVNVIYHKRVQLMIKIMPMFKFRLYVHADE